MAALLTLPGKRLLRSILEHDTQEFLDLPLPDIWFLDEEKVVLETIREHLGRYGAIPKYSTVHDLLGVDLPEAPEVPRFYIEHVQYRYLHNTLRSALTSASELMGEKKAPQARDMLLQTVSELMMGGYSRKLVNLAQEGYDILTESMEHSKKRIPTGWPSIDNASGGLEGGDVMVIAGRPGMGKSYSALYMCLHVWKTCQIPILFVSMEMKPALVVKRLGAMLAGVPITPIKKGDPSPYLLDQVRQSLHDAQDRPPFYILDGALAATATDIATVVRQLNPGFVVVDGAYLVTPTQHYRADWEKVKYVIEDLKKVVAEGLDLPVLAVYQLNRGAVQKKNGKKDADEGEDMGVEVLAGSDAIGQIASLVLAMADIETVNNLNRKKVRILKGRSGECGSFWINWIFDEAGPNGYMDFSESDPEITEDQRLPEEVPCIDDF